MKLLTCPHCQDVFSLRFEERRCECGRVSGRYESDGRTARTNGEGVSIAIGNGSFWAAAGEAMFREREDETRDRAYYQEERSVLCWVRPNEGPGNPHTNVVPD